MTEELKYYFGFRVINPAGKWVICGPFDTNEQAKADRGKSKAIDSQVTIPFVASSKEEAEENVHLF